MLKIVNGVEVEMTAQEEAEFIADQNKPRPWQELRRQEYASENWLELLLDDKVNGTNIAATKYAAIKTKIPKGV